MLLRGPSGSGKSDLALRLVEAGAELVADDQTELVAENGRLLASPPDTIAGLLEVRGVGIVPMAFRRRVPVALVVDLVAREAVPRLPDPATVGYDGVELPLIALDPMAASAAAKVRLAVRQLHCDKAPRHDRHG